MISLFLYSQRIAEALVVCNGDSVTSIPLIRSVGNLSSGQIFLLLVIMH